jgi:uracil-DNA glycosylase family 4
LIVGEFPGEVELEHGRPFTGPTGKVLKAEMRAAGLEYSACRVVNLWLHEPNDDENCYRAGLDVVMDEAKGRQAILLVGSACAETFTDHKIMEICGMRVESPLLSCDTVFAMVNPAIVFQPNKGVGELRLALKKFTDACKQKGLIDD